jgi:hypothetical protein
MGKKYGYVCKCCKKVVLNSLLLNNHAKLYRKTSKRSILEQDS